MATINGVTLTGFNLRVVAIHRNSMIDIPGSDTNYITDMEYNGLVLRMAGFETTLATYDAVIKEFMKSGPQTLLIRTGWQYSVYSAQLTPSMLGGFPDNYFPYDLMLYTATPYRETTTETTRSKTITTNNQEWSQDDSANDINTSGNVDAEPDIQITGGAVVATANRLSGLRFDDTDPATYTQPNGTYILKKTFTYAANPNRSYILATVGLDLRNWATSATGYGKITYEIAGGGEVTAGEWSQIGLTWYTKSASPGISTSLNESLVVRFYVKSSSSSPSDGEIKNLVSTVTTLRKDVCKNPQIYNVVDTTIESEIANEIEPDMIVVVNIDGTGTIIYADDVSTSKYLDAYWDKNGVVYDNPNNELDFGNDEYLTYKFDTKYPITGIPVLTATVDIDTGTPTIQISEDGITWYDIDTAIVDNVSTAYNLDNASNLSLKGSTEFYLKFDCDGSSTCSLVAFSLAIAIITIDVERPKITTGGSASTFRCDQHISSGLACTVALIFRDRSWAG